MSERAARIAIDIASEIGCEIAFTVLLGTAAWMLWGIIEQGNDLPSLDWIQACAAILLLRMVVRTCFGMVYREMVEMK